MSAERPSVDDSLIEVLDRVLDKGLVIAAHLRVDPWGIDLTDSDVRLVVTSAETHLDRSPECAFPTPQLPSVLYADWAGALDGHTIDRRATAEGRSFDAGGPAGGPSGSEE